MSDIMVLMVASIVVLIIIMVINIKDIMDIVDIVDIMVIVMDSLFIVESIALISAEVVINIKDKHMGSSSKQFIVDSKLGLGAIKLAVKVVINM